MAKLNQPGVRAATRSFVKTAKAPAGRTHQGGVGYERDVKSELFLLAVANMVSENTFYEPGGQRDERYANLIHQATLEDEDWTVRFLGWLRGAANMRTASIVGAAEFVKARLDAGVESQPNNDSDDTVRGLSRQVVDSVLQRADEPGELIAYWISVHGRNIPKPIKRGVADATKRLYNEFNFLKWDSQSRGVRMADVLSIAHPVAGPEWQNALFGYIRDLRIGKDVEGIPVPLTKLIEREKLMQLPVEERRAVLLSSEGPGRLQEAGMTWESLAGWLQGPMDKKAWEAIIPSMGYMALIRNLRNFDQAEVSDEVAAEIAAKLADPERVARSRQFPMRFLSAYRAAPSLRWSWPLEKAIDASLANVPELKGNTLILVDTSGSMAAGFSKDGTLQRWDAAAIFGIALSRRCANADVVSFSGGWYDDTQTKIFSVKSGESLLKATERWKNGGYFLNGGTNTEGAIRKHLTTKHNRVVILTDEQNGRGNVDSVVPEKKALYTWNLAGYRLGHAPSGFSNRHTFGGLSDAAFKMIPLLEAGRDADWPF